MTVVTFTVTIDARGDRGVNAVIERGYRNLQTGRWETKRQIRTFVGMHRIRPLGSRSREEPVRIDPDAVVDPSDYWIVLEGESGEADLIVPRFLDYDRNPPPPLSAHGGTPPL